MAESTGLAPRAPPDRERHGSLQAPGSRRRTFSRGVGARRPTSSRPAKGHHIVHDHFHQSDEEVCYGDQVCIMDDTKHGLMVVNHTWLVKSLPSPSKPRNHCH